MQEVIYRFGTSYESASRLGAKAAQAEQAMGIHGVSVSEAEPSIPSSSAFKIEVEQYFRLYETPTRNDPLHYTVELPKPVTREVADIFNNLFGRQRR